jgi:hypothetical protein
MHTASRASWSVRMRAICHRDGDGDRRRWRAAGRRPAERGRLGYRYLAGASALAADPRGARPGLPTRARASIPGRHRKPCRTYPRILNQGVDAAEVTTESHSIYGFHIVSRVDDFEMFGETLARQFRTNRRALAIRPRTAPARPAALSARVAVRRPRRPRAVTRASPRSLVWVRLGSVTPDKRRASPRRSPRGTRPQPT